MAKNSNQRLLGYLHSAVLILEAADEELGAYMTNDKEKMLIRITNMLRGFEQTMWDLENLQGDKDDYVAARTKA